MSESGKGNRQRLQWHPAFGAALRITFAEEIERKELELQEEYLLSKKPPQIDVLIIIKRSEGSSESIILSSIRRRMTT